MALMKLSTRLSAAAGPKLQARAPQKREQKDGRGLNRR